MAELGYVEGRNLVIDFRTAVGQPDRLPTLAADLVGRQPDVFVAFATQSAIAAKNATQTIPIVLGAVGDPVGSGIVPSLARPGGNITGASLLINRSALISGETSYRLELFSVTPPSAYAEGDAFALASGDHASYLGSVDLGVPVDKGDALFVQQTGINLPLMLAGANVFAYLVTVGAYTSTAVAYTPKLHTLAV